MPTTVGVGDSLFGDKVFSGPQGMDNESFMPFFVCIRHKFMHENYAIHTFGLMTITQKNQQEPAQFLPEKQKCSTFAEQKSLRSQQIKILRYENKTLFNILAIRHINVIGSNTKEAYHYDSPKRSLV